MKYILTIIPFSKDGGQAASTALCIANRIGATLLIVDKAAALVPVKRLVASGAGLLDDYEEEERYTPVEFIQMLKKDQHSMEESLVECVAEEDLYKNSGKFNAEEIGLIVTYREHAYPDLNDGDMITSLLRRTKCPVLKISRNRSLKLIRKLGYVTDIRYCDIAILKPLVEFCRPFNTELLLIHVTASGLPDIENNYAEKLFATELIPMMNYKNAVLINLLGKDMIDDIKNVAEVMKPDVIALSSKKYWFYDRLFPDVGGQRPSYADIPLLLFN